MILIDLFRKLEDALSAGQRCVYCAVVDSRGSTPQKAGAVMIVFHDGRQLGTLGGGCIEAEVRQKALAGPEGPAVHGFTLDRDYGWDDGLICGGQMRIFTAPLDPARDLSYYRTYRELLESGHGCCEAIVIDPEPGREPGARYLFDQARVLRARSTEGDPPEHLAAALPDPAVRPRCRLENGVAILPQLSRCRLVIIGAGHVGQAVAELAARVDFDIWVIDDREAYANSSRFPAASRILVGNIGQVLPGFEVHPDDYVLVVTRGHNHDEEALHHMAASCARYVGMIGSRRKIKLIHDDLRDQGVPEWALARSHCPLGIPIGSQTVPEIAVSVVAELIAHRNLGCSPRGRVRTQILCDQPGE